MTKQGFTLIELLVVILMIGILSSIALPKYTHSIQRARAAEGLVQGKILYEAALRFQSQNNQVPTKLEQLDITFQGSTGSSNTFTKGNFTYKLPPTTVSADADHVKATNTKEGYELRFFFPTRDANGVYAPVGCCPGDNADAQWLCNNIGKPHTYESVTNLLDCTEVK